MKAREVAQATLAAAAMKAQQESKAKEKIVEIESDCEMESGDEQVKELEELAEEDFGIIIEDTKSDAQKKGRGKGEEKS